jgi:CDP-diacylglycerol--glycerol-3-phosphate 3-phosphatidyltransferase
VSVGLAVLIFARELLVTSLRGIIEGSGKDFSARWLGKWKMVAQCAAGLLVLLALALESPPEWVTYLKWFALLATGVLTVWSGYDYVMAAGRVLSSQSSVDLHEPPHV